MKDFSTLSQNQAANVIVALLNCNNVIDIVDNAGFSYFSLGTLEELGYYTLASYLDELRAMPAYRVVPASEMADDFDGVVDLDEFDCCVEFSNPQQPGSAVQFLLWEVDDFKDSELPEQGEKTYYVQFSDYDKIKSKGWSMPYDYCKSYIEYNNSTNNSDFADYKGGTVSIVCNETGEVVYHEEIK